MNDDIKLEKSTGNVFDDLGLPEAGERLAKADLALKIAQIINKRHLSQAQAAELLGITQPKVSAILNGRLRGFSLEKLLHLMIALDRDIEIVVKRKPRTKDHGELRVKYA
ncbi:helix-turn-helix domain-containing protein [Geoalkalibacter subterraneus]|uniref:XRE family transcriptional regulator n=1 Tax=Geoalkalibacter subterraneus TaxID=483547 RepID=A0A0B5FK65_9BACT|nr:helix-turn-helix transcriptional regulator [Geoalkalibacter subterraneus]AJF07803.1 XRE family transcriptional regulator [Geoalkalibacter subterraneus]